MHQQVLMALHNVIKECNGMESETDVFHVKTS